MRLTHILMPCLASTALLLAACAPAPLYKPAPDTIHVPPAAVAQAPERFSHASAIWGGRIVKVTNLSDRTLVELLSYPLDSSQRPQIDEAASGRFIAVVPGYLEPLNYPPGRLMTVSGSLKGTRSGKVGAADYVFPLVDVVDYHLWTAEELRSPWSNVHFGVGVGTSF
ncbi:MAG TPA: Slp family lipoprotein [Oleiagrimonas sp.]|nr:Slp family lipoprotein [Oleiagrimonas sp.]